MRIAVIPARGGSKRIPRKNIRDFVGQPLIGWTITNLRSSGLFDAVFVSTEDSEIAEVAKRFGADVPFFREQSLADDVTGTDEVVADFIAKFEEKTSEVVGQVCVAYAAAVGFSGPHLQRSLDLLQAGNVDLVFAGVKFPAPIERAWRRHDSGLVEMLTPEYRRVRTQDLEESFYDAGQVYWWREGLWRTIGGGGTVRRSMYEVPREDAVDIDTEDDWKFAEFLFRSRLNPGI